jgi:hypothetical protein
VSPTFNDQQKFREQLRMATGRDLRANQARRRRTRNFAIAGVTASALAASGVTVVAPWNGGPTLGERAEAALTPPPNVVVHQKIRQGSVERGVVVLKSYEVESWSQTSAVQSRSIATHQPMRQEKPNIYVPDGPPRTVENDFSADPATGIGIEHWYEAATGLLVEGRPYESGAPRPGSDDSSSSLRARLKEGAFKLDGATEIDGRPVQRLRDEFGSDGQRYVETYFVDPITFAPVRWQVEWFFNGVQKGTNTTDYLVYEELPATPENIALTSVVGSHPGVRVRARDSVPLAELPGGFTGG